jgi:O-antigen/teichoic acid export membrane protein
MGVKQRILQGIYANGFGQAVTLLIQIASVPILIRAWGVELYGEWIILSAVPSYLTLSDIGLTTIAGNMLALAADRRRDDAEIRAVYQSAWAMVTLLSAAVLIPVVTLIWLTEPGRILGLARITGRTLDLTLLLLFLHVAMSMQTGILQLPFRVIKENPFSVAAANTIRLLEWLGATLVVLAGGTVVEVAMAFLCVRTLGNAALGWLVTRSGSPLEIGFRYANGEVMRTLLRPSLASLCFPLGLSLAMQGFVLLIGHLVGAGGVALFSVYRTFTRVPIQVATSINQAVWPELSYAFGANDFAKAKRLVIKMLQFGAALSAVTIVAVFFTGERVIDWWVSSSLEHSPALLIALALTALVHVLWQPFWVAQIAINRHSRFAAWFLLVSALSLLVGWLLVEDFALNGAGYAVFLSECVLGVAAVVTFARYFDRAAA